MKFGGETQGGKGRLIGIALSRRNCERLLEGDPITFSLEELGLRVVPMRGGRTRDGQILLVAGETENAILGELMQVSRDAGVELKTMGLDGEPSGE